MTYEIPLDEAAGRLAELVDRVNDRGDKVVLLRDEKPIAELMPASLRVKLKDLPAVLASLPHLSREEADAFAADLEEIRWEVGREPERDPWES